MGRNAHAPGRALNSALVRDLVSRLRPLFLFAGLFSLAINLLLLVPPLYMLQVFDRVLASRSGETLAVLTLAALIALVVMALLDVLRARLLAAAGARARPEARPARARRAARADGAARRHGATSTGCATSHTLRASSAGRADGAVRRAVAADLPAGDLPVPSAARRRGVAGRRGRDGDARVPQRAPDARRRSSARRRRRGAPGASSTSARATPRW